MCTKYQIILSYKRAAIPINKVIPDLASQVLEDSMQVFARLLSSWWMCGGCVGADNKKYLFSWLRGGERSPAFNDWVIDGKHEK